MSSLMARMPDELLARCAGWLDTPTARRLAQVSRAGERLVLARLAAEKAERAAQAAAVVAAQAAPRQHTLHSRLPTRLSSTRLPTCGKLPPLASASMLLNTSSRQPVVSSTLAPRYGRPRWCAIGLLRSKKVGMAL